VVLKAFPSSSPIYPGFPKAAIVRLLLSLAHPTTSADTTGNRDTGDYANHLYHHHHHHHHGPHEVLLGGDGWVGDWLYPQLRGVLFQQQQGPEEEEEEINKNNNHHNNKVAGIHPSIHFIHHDDDDDDAIYLLSSNQTMPSDGFTRFPWATEGDAYLNLPGE